MLVLLVSVQILVRLDWFSHSITMEVWKPARWKRTKFHQNEHTPGISHVTLDIKMFQLKCWGVLVLLKFYWAPDIVEFVLGRFSHFNIAITYSNCTFCGAWTSTFCEFTQNFSKTSTPLGCARFAEILTIFQWTHKKLEFRCQKILNSQINFQLDIHFISFLCLHVGILQHCPNPLHQLVPNVVLF